jgi:hypothetical protein
VSDLTETARDALEAAYVEHADSDPNKYELFAHADGLPDEITADEAVAIAADVLSDPPAPDTAESALKTWEDADFAATTPGVYPDEMTEYGGWMTHKGNKLPYAPWTDYDAPAPCSEHDTTADQCDCSARYKWGWEPNRRPFEKANLAAEDDARYGLVFIQTESDPFVFVDGDDVRDPETGAVHPAFIALLEHFGLTYADVSTSGTGVHAVYRGDLPADETVATWEIDTEPWGGNDEPPAIEIYSGKHVNVTTGDHVDGTPDGVTVWDAETAHHIVEANGCVDNTARQSLQADFDDTDGRSDSGGSASDQIRALNRLDARKVAERTIVADWTDTSGKLDAFHPTWGTGSKGTANIVDREMWVDTGKEDGHGGPIEMALIDMNELDHTDAEFGCASGSDFWTGYEHLRDLGFNLPDPPYETDDDTANDYYDADLSAHTDGDAWSDPDAMLEACLSVREAGAVPSDVEPPALALIPITRDLLGVEEPSAATREEAVDVYHDMTVDDHDGEKVLL